MFARATKGDMTPLEKNFAKSYGKHLFLSERKRPTKLLAGAFVDLFAAKNNF
jgi:hypothetical protein